MPDLYQEPPPNLNRSEQPPIVPERRVEPEAMPPAASAPNVPAAAMPEILLTDTQQETEAADLPAATQALPRQALTGAIAAAYNHELPTPELTGLAAQVAATVANNSVEGGNES
jgi:hypothetical protein